LTRLAHLSENLGMIASSLAKQLPQFDQIRSVHIVGVCGTLMGSFAAYLKRKGIHVTGSDQNVYPPMSDVLSQAGVQLFSGYNAENLLSMKERPDLVVIGNVISSGNPEARVAIDQGYAYSSLPEAMERLLLEPTRNLVVSGTHGKTTTSSMLAHVLVQAGEDPSYFIGGVSQDLPFSFHVGNSASGRPFVLEGDEYDTAFWDKVPKFNHYLPNDVILTSVEYDHADIYPNIEAVILAFDGLVKRIRPNGRLIACLDYDLVADLAKKATVPVITYAVSSKKGARFTVGAHSVEESPTEPGAMMTRFEVLDGGKKVEEIVMQASGLHNMSNALAVWLECREMGIASPKILSGLRSFRGVKRRQEVRGEVRGVIVLDDFAHHPTAVRETLKALKLRYPKRRIVSVFEPRSATSRRKVFQKDYGDAFCEGDATFIAVPYDQSKIAADDQFSSDQLVSDLVTRGRSAHLMASVEEGVEQVSKFSRSGDLVAVLSNGGFGGFIPKLLEALKNS
jgi:UDP-N-acetylmuramate: L-alanyl-gamma-D-glutamyl-meso-diaminopimelate ligase